MIALDPHSMSQEMEQETWMPRHRHLSTVLDLYVDDDHETTSDGVNPLQLVTWPAGIRQRINEFRRMFSMVALPVSPKVFVAS